MSGNKKVKGANWTSQETTMFLEKCAEKNIIRLMKGKRHKHTDIYKVVQEAMEQAGCIKTISQLRIKLKHLKEMYYKCKRGMDRDSFDYFDLMESLMSSRPKTLAGKPITNRDEGATVDTSAFIKAESVEIKEEVESISMDGMDSVEDSAEIDSDSSPTPSSTIPNASSSSTTKPCPKGGRNSYNTQMKDFLEVFCQKQFDELKSFAQHQQDLFQANMAQELEKQRQWEMKLAEQEREFQTRQMAVMLQSLQQLTAPRSNGQFHTQNPPVHPHQMCSHPNHLPPAIKLHDVTTAAPQPEPQSSYTVQGVGDFDLGEDRGI